jgi:lipopolysaccharide export system protein LptA
MFNLLSRSSLYLLVASFVTLIFISHSAPCWAEQADREKPIVAESDKLTLDNVKKISIFEGNVIITQGTMRITADRVQITEDKDGMRHASGTGNPCTFRQKRDGVDEYVDGHSQRFEYDGKIDRLELFEQAELKRGQDDVKGEYIAYDTVTEFFKVNGNASRDASGAGRVHAIIQPAQQTNRTVAAPSSSPPPPPAAPITKPSPGPDKR